MKTRLTKAEALELFRYDEAAREKALAAGEPHPGPRGIVNARWLGLSKQRYRAPRTKRFDRQAARRQLRSVHVRAGLAGEL